MTPKVHTASSIILAVVLYYFSHSLGLLFSTLLAGIFIDLDHLIDFWKSKPQNPFSIKEFLRPRGYMKQNHKAFVPLHSYELIAILWLLAFRTHWNPILIGLSSGFTLHLILDDIGNDLKTFSYFIVYRIAKKFQVLKEGEGWETPTLMNPLKKL